MPEIDLLEIDRGTVTAPAGCGKTHLIAQAILRHADRKPVLVLTHTNAGVAALRTRLSRAGAGADRYRLSTIDGWCLRLLSTFPRRSGIDPAVLEINMPRQDYPAIRSAAARLLQSGHLDDLLASTYDRLIVDEYQDCSESQHDAVASASRYLRTVVLGDPMQAIFSFPGNVLAKWKDDVCTRFPIVAQLRLPWRWKNAGEENFGHYLLDVRRALIAGETVDLARAPRNVDWAQLDGRNDHAVKLRAGRSPLHAGEKAIIMADSRNPSGQRSFAGKIAGAVAVENVDMSDLVSFAEDLDLRSDGLLRHVVDFASSIMVNTAGGGLVDRVEILKAKRQRRAPSAAEDAALRLVAKPSYSGIADLLNEIAQEGGVRAHRPAILGGAMRLLRSCAVDGLEPRDSAQRERERSRITGRPLATRTVGSTLLLKGLEADVAVILEADLMDRRHLYVAMTRGAKRLVVCSRDAVLRPAR